MSTETPDDFQLTEIRVEATEDTRVDVEPGALLGRGVEFPSGMIILEWNRDVYSDSDRLETPHQSIYGSRSDVEQGTGGRLVDVDAEAAAEAEAEADAEPELPPDDRHVFTGESFAIRSTIHTPPMRYSFIADDVTDASSLEGADSYTETDDGRYRVTGTIGPRGSDTYYLEGRISGWEAEHAETGDSVPSTRYETAVAGEPRELWKLLGVDAPMYDDTSAESIGGGDHYSQKVTEADADVVVSSHDELREALGTAEPGDVVFVDPDTECYSPSKGERYHVPAGVTLASNRGVDGSPGALLHTDAAYSYGAEGLVDVEGDDARVTGLRIRGPHPDVEWRDHSYDYEMAGVNARYNGAKRLEVDNCEIYGWAHAVAAGEDSHVHHNHLHTLNMKGLGYCTSIGSTEGTIFEFNHCEHWRHVIAGGGGGGYEARFNLVDGPCIAHAFDQHAPGGSYTKIHHNTMTVAEPVTGDPRVPFATFRGDNVRKARVWKNWVFNDWERRDECAGFTDEWITHAKDGGTCFDDIRYWDNHLGDSEPPSSDIGCPR